MPILNVKIRPILTPVNPNVLSEQIQILVGIFKYHFLEIVITLILE